MTDKQPEALRLACQLEAAYPHIHAGLAPAASAELRRLQAENKDFRATCDHLTRENAEQIGEIVALKEQRDELLGALQSYMAGIEAMGWNTNKAKAAIAKATGETK